MSEHILSFLRVCGKLKHLQRTGWVKRNVSQPETVASHMYRMAMISMIVPDDKIDKVKAMKMCIVHDLAESIVGDITPNCGVSDDEKFSREKQAMEMLKDMLNKSNIVGDVADEILQLWMEYEECKTPEALFVKDLDRFDMILQADEYERAQGIDLQEFFDSTKGKFQHPFIVNLEKQLNKEREERMKK